MASCKHELVRCLGCGEELQCATLGEGGDGGGILLAGDDGIIWDPDTVFVNSGGRRVAKNSVHAQKRSKKDEGEE